MAESWGIKEAAAFLHIHPDTLAERARAGEIPGCKVGRAWVFLPELLTEYLRSKSAEQAEKFNRVGNVQASLAERLAGRLAQRTAGRRRRA
jgi:excisionase family DNA binding protein